MNQSLFSASVPVSSVEVSDPFWKRMMEKVRCSMIPYQWRVLNDEEPGAEKSHCMANFKIAAGMMEGEFYGRVFQDTDFYKWVEAVGFSLMWHPDPELEKTADEAIAIVCKAQKPDGYLDTYYILTDYEKRFTNLMANHELYCLGHLIEGAVVYYQATGKDPLLKAAMKYADCVAAVIGPEEGKIHGYPGHEVAEMALVRLYELTKEEKYLKLAKYFIDQRGQSPLFFDEERKRYHNLFKWEDSAFQYDYYQAGKPVREQTVARGHAVRAMYLYSGMADVARLTGDDSLKKACETLWNSAVNRQMYIIGSIGSSEYGEAFTYEYDLPNDTAYTETCAAIGLAFFARRMLEMEPKGCYADAMERALFNGIISGVSLDGTRFFYVNPLEVEPRLKDKEYEKHRLAYEREKWLVCACCPPNLARLTASIGNYAYSVGTDTFYSHLYLGGEVQAQLDGKAVKVCTQSNYPWDEEIKVTFHCEPAKFKYAIRIPGWCENYQLFLNGDPVEGQVREGYAYFDRVWKEGDTITAKFEMPVLMVEANPRVRKDLGKVAVTRGPLVYCLEGVDNGEDLHRIYLGEHPQFVCKWEPDLLDGVVSITAKGEKMKQDNWDENTLYRIRGPVSYEEKTLKFIPYYAWANRGENEMIVWVNRK